MLHVTTSNPLCHFQEPKLSAARRIVAEWTDYDDEMHRLGEQIAKDRSANSSDNKLDESDNKKDELQSRFWVEH